MITKQKKLFKWTSARSIIISILPDSVQQPKNCTTYGCGSNFFIKLSSDMKSCLSFSVAVSSNWKEFHLDHQISIRRFLEDNNMKLEYINKKLKPHWLMGRLHESRRVTRVSLPIRVKPSTNKLLLVFIRWPGQRVLPGYPLQDPGRPGLTRSESVKFLSFFLCKLGLTIP